MLHATLLPKIGPRIVLRRLDVGDLHNFQSYRHDPEVGRYQGWLPQPDAEAAAFLREMATVPLFQLDEWAQIGIADGDTDMLIGDIGICIAADLENAEIGFTLNAGWQGRGLGVEAVTMAMALIFEATPVDKIRGVTDSRNIRSARLMERAGMQLETAESTVFRGEPCTEYGYALKREAASARQKA